MNFLLTLLKTALYSIKSILHLRAVNPANKKAVENTAKNNDQL